MISTYSILLFRRPPPYYELLLLFFSFEQIDKDLPLLFYLLVVFLRFTI